MKTIWAAAAVMFLATGCTSTAATVEERTFVLASTTSTQDSGFLDALAPRFEAANPGLKMKVIAVGSGEALELGRRGDADVLLAHSPEDEERFMREGFGTVRYPVMTNRFVVVGPPADPAAVSRAQDAAASFASIASNRHRFVSRGDGSGTHRREIATWKLAGVEPSGSWYTVSGQGMAETLVIASELKAYTLTDTATFKTTPDLDLRIHLDGDPRLVNHYSVIVARSARDRKAGLTFARWITSKHGVELIVSFGSKGEEPLFIPAHNQPTEEP